MSRPASTLNPPTSRSSAGRETAPLLHSSLPRRTSFASVRRRSIATTDGHSNNSHDDDRDMAQVVCGSFFNLTVGLAGMQFIWTVELGYGTPYLLALGMPQNLLPLVWSAGPLSGLLIQPAVGAYSDVSTNRLGRRRPYIILLDVWTQQKGHYSNDDPVIGQMAIGIAVAGFFILDFSINAVQACLRALVVDVASLDSQSRANAWASRMLGIGSVIGYFTGYLDLVFLFPELGTTQMEVLCSIGSIVFAVCIAWTCLMVREERYVRGMDAQQHAWYKPLRDVFHVLWHLPDPIQRLCTTQFFAWMAWFPFLFYSTTWIINVLMRDHSPTEPGFLDAATRAGTLVDSIVASWRLRGVWIFSNVFFGIVLLSTWFARDVYDATIIVALCGLPWAVVLWVPFAMIGELLNVTNEEQRVFKYIPNTATSPSASSTSLGIDYPNSPNSISSSSLFREGSAALARNSQLRESIIEANHNDDISLESVLPQFVSTIVATIIFAMFNDPNSVGHHDDGIGTGTSNEAVGWVLRFGGVCALIAAIMASRCIQVDTHRP
ncbi:major facilitator superfamily domain-containing protein [Syncephalis fuscata]|nr:major facilitator superfamily domain-containing protein [Syncephalis fuscata]